jgi:hypothetical protein
MTLPHVGDDKICCSYCRILSNFDFFFYGRTYLGFGDTLVVNSHLTGGHYHPADGIFTKLIRKTISGLTWGGFKSIEKLSRGRWVWGPSVQVIARKRTGGCSP